MRTTPIPTRIDTLAPFESIVRCALCGELVMSRERCWTYTPAYPERAGRCPPRALVGFGPATFKLTGAGFSYLPVVNVSLSPTASLTSITGLTSLSLIGLTP